MMNSIQRKLNSKRGASMILVLALFLICVMVSSVIIGTASAGVSRNAQRAEQQKGYLAVSSASNLIVEELEHLGVYAGSKKTGRYGCEDCTVEGYIYYNGSRISGYRLDAEYTSNPLDAGYAANPLDDGHLIVRDVEHAPYFVMEVDESNTTLNGMLADVFERGCTHVFKVGTAYTEKFTIALKEEDDRLPVVTCHFEMDENYDVKFVLTTEDSKYAVSVSCMSTSEKTQSTEVGFDDHKIYYKKFIVDRGIYETVEDTWSIPVEITSTTTRIWWGGPKVVKEVLSPND